MASILVIDDNVDMRETLEQALKLAGHSVVLAADGQEGLRQFLATPPDLVITDLVMPKKEGIETIIEMRRHCPGIKIIAISGDSAAHASVYLMLAEKLGAGKTLTKPFSARELLDSVQALLAPPREN